MKRSIRWQLLWLGALTVVPALIVLGGTQWMSRRGALSRTIEESQRVARLAAAEQSSVFGSTDLLLRTLSAAHIPNGPDCNAALADVRAEHPQYLNLSVIDPSGTVVCSALAVALGTNVSDRDWFQRLITMRRPVVGNFQIGKVIRKADLIVAVPKLDANGGIERIFGAAIEVKQFSAKAATATLPPGAVLTLLDRNQTIIFRHPDTDKWVGKTAPASDTAKLIFAGAPDDVREVKSVDGVTRLWVSVPVETGGDGIMILGFGVPNSIAFAEANRLLRQSIWLFLAVVAATMGIAAFTGERFVVRPFEQLTDVTRRIGAGNLDARVQLSESVPAVRGLADSINEMAIALEHRRSDEEQLRVLVHAIESTNEMVSVTDLNDRLTFVNRAFLQTYGYSEDEVLGRTPEMLRPPDIAPSVPAEILEETRHGGWHGELVNCRKDGSEIFISLNTSLIRGNDGKVLGLLGVARDISRRLKAEQALRDAESRMRFALTASRVGVWEVDVVAETFFGSSIHEAMHGLVPSESGGTMQRLLDGIHPDDRARVRQMLLDAVQTPRDVELEYRSVWPNGSEHWIRASASRLSDQEGGSSRVAGIAVDVTERRALEDRLRQANKMEAIGQLAGGIAHDFNNILTVILGSVELLMQASKGAPPPQELADIKTAGKSAAALTHQLLAFSRRQVLQPQAFDLNEVVKGLSPLIRRVIGEDLKFNTILAPDLDRVVADRSQLEQVVLNLVVNARDAMPEGGTLTIATAHATGDELFMAPSAVANNGGYVRLSLIDTGVGMDERTRARLFEPFFTTKPVGKGTGLGLATVYGILKQSGGYVSVDTAPGAGSTFHVYLPRTTELPESLSESGSSKRGTETVLLVEDEPAVRSIATRILQSAGYGLLTASGPSEALDIARRHPGPIHALLTDVVMPDMNGFDLAKHITKERQETRVLFMSGYPSRDGLPVDLQTNITLIAKPFSPDGLLNQMRALLDA